jgi:energy-coupling factor transport system substrate-specific component
VRIIAAADSYDAMASTRAYRLARDPEYIVGELRKYSGTQFDPDVADVFIEMITSGQMRSAS